MKDTTSLKYFKILEEKLTDYGFKKENEIWVCEKPILENEFLLKIAIDKGVILSSVTEVATNERFVLYDIENHNGAFVSKMHSEYENVVATVIKNCTEKDVFKSAQAKEIINYIKGKYGDELEFLWEKFPDNAIFRNKTNKKWYCLIAGVEKKKIFGWGEEKIEIADLNLSPERAAEIVDNKNIFKGYHMNKKTWITIPLNGVVENQKIFSLVDESYSVSAKKK